MNPSSSLAPNPEQRIMAALAHASVVLPVTGVLAPILIWVTQKEKSPYVAFQALQAVFYHVLLLAAGFVGMSCYMLSFFGMMFGTMFASSSDSQSQADPVFAVFFAIPFAIFALMFLGGFVWIGYGLFAAIQALQGKPFRYAVLGNRIERFMLGAGGAATDAKPPI